MEETFGRKPDSGRVSIWTLSPESNGRNSADGRDSARAQFAQGFNEQPTHPAEREKTQEEKAIIGDILSAMPEFVMRYGGIPLPIREDHIHVLDVAKLRRLMSTDENIRLEFEPLIETMSRAYFSDEKQCNYVFDYGEGSALSFGETVVHEVIHPQEFWSKRYEDDVNPKELETMRAGIQFLHRGRRIFGRLQPKKQILPRFHEALVEELAKRFCDQYFPVLPSTKEKHRTKERLKKYSSDPDNVVDIVKDTARGGYRVSYYAYEDDRTMFNAVVDDLFQKNHGEFSSREDIFNLFARAAFSKDLLPLARLMNKTYGEQSFERLEGIGEELIRSGSL